MPKVTYRKVHTQGRTMLRWAINEHGLSVEEAAARLCMSWRGLYLILGGYTRPSLDGALMIEMVFGIKPRYWRRSVEKLKPVTGSGGKE